MNKESNFSTFIGSYCKVMSKKQSSTRAQVTRGSITSINQLNQSITIQNDNTTIELPLNSIVAIRKIN